MSAPRRINEGSVCLCALLALSWNAGADAETTPVKGIVDARVRLADYDVDEVYKLRGFVGYQIDLEFEAGEAFLGLGAGDIEGLSFIGQENHLFIKPRADQVATNLTVLTSRRHYQFDYIVSAQPPKSEDDVIYALRFNYPVASAESAEEEAAKHLDSQLGSASSTRPHNMDYWYCGESALRPVGASDDGVHTRLTFSANAELPAIFVRNDDDSESLLNFNVDAGDVVIHRVARRFIVRRGKLAGCIVNLGFAGGGKRLESGTVAPDVERRVQAGVP